MGHRRDRLLMGLTGGTVVLGAGYATGLPDAATAVVTAWIFVAAVHAVLVGVAASTARTPGLPAGARRFWWAVTAGAAVYLAGDLAQVVTAALAPRAGAAATGGPVQQATLSAGSAVLMLALLAMPLGFASRRERTRFWLDLSTVMTAAVVVGWYLVVPDEPAALLDAAAPVFTGPVILLLCVFVVAKLTMTGTAPFTRACALLGTCGAAAKSAADAIGRDGLTDGRLHWFLALTVAAHALLTIAIRVNQMQVSGNPRVLARARRPYSLLPYGAIAVTYGLLILAVWRRDGATVPIALGGAAVSTLLVIGRQLAAFRENARLLGELDARVRELHTTQDGLRRSLAERDTLAAQLRHQAFHDALTGLPNRALYAERLDAALASGVAATVMLIDLDGFKRVNDGYGHAAGDDLLRAVAARLSGCVRAGDTVARLGGDEFAVLLAPDAAEDPRAVAARMIAALRAPVAVEGGTVRVGASVGIATGTTPGVLRDADHAMYEAKRSGKGSFAVHAPLSAPTAG